MKSNEALAFLPHSFIIQVAPSGVEHAKQEDDDENKTDNNGDTQPDEPAQFSTASGGI